MPKITQKCIESWKKYCPDYEIKRWDESNLNLDKYQFVRDAYDAKKFAFASDVLRTDIIYSEGGIYLDVDVELLKPIEEFMDKDLFVGFETSDLLNPGLIMGATPKNGDLKNILDIYKKTKFEVDKCKDLTICHIYTDYFEKMGLEPVNKTQELKNYKFYSSEYFSPIDVITNKKKITKNTYSIHWYNASWYSPKQKARSTLKKVLNFCTFGMAGKVYERRKMRKQKAN